MDEVGELADMDLRETIDKLIEEMDARIYNQLNASKISDVSIENISRTAAQISNFLRSSPDRSLVELTKLIEICLYRILFCGPQKQRHGLRLISEALNVVKHHLSQYGVVFDGNKIADIALTLWSWLDRNSYNS